MMPGTGQELSLNNYKKRIFGKALLSVSTYFDTSAQADSRNGSFETSSNLKWYASATYISTTTNSSTQNYGGLSINVRTIT